MRIAVAVLALAGLSFAQTEQAPAWLDPFEKDVEGLLERFGVAGAGIALVKDGKVLLAKGYGTRNHDEKLAANADTLFAIGSCTKAFTALGVGLLIEDGKVKMDMPIREYIPFTMKDEMAGGRITAEDLLTHRSGLPRHDLSWYGSKATRAELVRRIAHLPPSKQFRATWQYQNFMFVTAGWLIGRVSGSSWEAFTRKRILDPLGMKRSNFSVVDMQKDPDHALGYKGGEGRYERMEFRNIDAMGPAGSINSSAREMSKWLLLHLGSGSVHGKRLLKAATIADQHRPRIAIPRKPDAPELGWASYALGWMVRSYRGRTLVHHGGNIGGFSALVALVPADDAGIVILTNARGTLATTAIAYRAIDRLRGRQPIDWAKRLQRVRRQRARVANRRIQTSAREKQRNTKPSQPLRAYAGTYVHPGYGGLEIVRQGGALQMRYNGLKISLVHFHYDSFVPFANAFGGRRVRFALGSDGSVESCTIRMDPAAPPIGFVRKKTASKPERGKDGRSKTSR